MANCPNGTEIPLNEKLPWIIVKGCDEEEVMRELENNILNIAKKIRAERGSPCEGDCKATEDPEGEQPTCTLWVDYETTFSAIRAARVQGCPNDVGKIGFFQVVLKTAGCNCV